MNDSETEMKAKILKLLLKINDVVGDHLYISALWQVLLKNSQTQLQCIKAIFYKFEKSKEILKNLKLNDVNVEKINQIKEEEHEEDEKPQIPQKSQTPKFRSSEVASQEDINLRKEKFQQMIDNLKNHNKKNEINDFFPQTQMIKNAINKCLRNPNVHVVKGVLDLMIGFVSFKEGNLLIRSNIIF